MALLMHSRGPAPICLSPWTCKLQEQPMWDLLDGDCMRNADKVLTSLPSTPPLSRLHGLRRRSAEQGCSRRVVGGEHAHAPRRRAISGSLLKPLKRGERALWDVIREITDAKRRPTPLSMTPLQDEFERRLLCPPRNHPVGCLLTRP